MIFPKTGFPPRIKCGTGFFRIMLQSVQPETTAADEGAKVGAKRFRILSRLVLRPPVKFIAAKTLRLALIAVWPCRRAPAIVGVQFGKIFRKTLLVHCCVE